jgi:hypothetical protein
LAAEKEANQGLQQSVQTLTSQITVLNTKTADQAKRDTEKILRLENVSANRKTTIDKLNDE